MNRFDNLSVLLDNDQYFFQLFAKHLKEINPLAEKVLFHQLFFIKRHVGDDFLHYVVEHRLTLALKNGLKTKCRVYSISFSGHGRRSMYQAMSLVYGNKFGSGEVVVPKPLWYEEKTMSFFYLGIPGDTLLEHLKNGHFNLDYFKKITRALRRLHTTKSPAGIFKTHEFSLNYLDPTAVLSRPQNNHDPMKAAILKQLANLSHLKAEFIKDKNILSHGDFHPENIIIDKFNSDRLAFIDFSEICLAPCYYDLASFLLQLRLMSLGYLDAKTYRQIEKTILRYYFGETKLSAEVTRGLHLYQAWTALKSAIYSMIFIEEHNRHYAAYLISLSVEFSQKVK